MCRDVSSNILLDHMSVCPSSGLKQHSLYLHLYMCWFQVTSGSVAVYVSRDQEVWLETKDYRGMKGMQNGYSIFSGFLLPSHWLTLQFQINT